MTAIKNEKELTSEEIFEVDSLAAEYFRVKDMLAEIGKISIFANNIEMELDRLINTGCGLIGDEKALSLFLDRVDFAKKIDMVRALSVNRLTGKERRRMNRLLERATKARILRNDCIHAVWIVEHSGFPDGDAKLTKFARKKGKDKLDEEVLFEKLKRDVEQVWKASADFRAFVDGLLTAYQIQDQDQPEPEQTPFHDKSE